MMERILLAKLLFAFLLVRFLLLNSFEFFFFLAISVVLELGLSHREYLDYSMFVCRAGIGANAEKLPLIMLH